MTMIEFNGTPTKGSIAMSYLDSPSTTSAITYQVYVRAAANTTYFNLNTCKASITVMEIKG